MFLKTSIFALEASLLGQIFVLRTSNFRGATISRLNSARPRKIPGWIVVVRDYYPGLKKKTVEIV